jgi:hypothetical protein
MKPLQICDRVRDVPDPTCRSHNGLPSSPRLGEQTHVVLAFLAGGYFLLVATTAIVATFHREAGRRGCAQGTETTPAPRPPSSVSPPNSYAAAATR